MIVYRSDIDGFRRDVDTGDIDGIVLSQLRSVLGRGAAESEVRSWRASLTQMYVVLSDPEIPGDAGVGIEFQIPQTAKRIDFLISGRDAARRDQTVVVELKQWEAAEATAMDGVVQTYLGGAVRPTVHPSYQAWSYAELLSGFNEAVHAGDIDLHPCAYLHNLSDTTALNQPLYRSVVERAPLFAKSDVAQLRVFIREFIRHGDRGEVLVQIDQGRIRPSKSLADGVASLMQGNREFTMIDDQKVVYERVLDRVRSTPRHEKRVILVHGGPGTGKSVVAIQLLAALTQQQELAQYVTKNAAPRAVYEGRLTGTMTKTRYSNLFRGSGGFHTAERSTFRALVVDEAHRLNEKSGLYQNRGENQVAELIRAADVTVFFLDEDQRVTLADIGSRDEILYWARTEGAPVEEFELRSQFRCSGSDGYLAWLDHVLGIRPTANTDLDSLDHDYVFEVCDSPNDVRDRIVGLNGSSGRSRMVAGYCWDWNSKKSPEAWDVVIDEHDFRMRWNLTQHGSGWRTRNPSQRSAAFIPSKAWSSTTSASSSAMTCASKTVNS
jgi:hypothetical protein